MCVNGAKAAHTKFDRTLNATTYDQSELVNTIAITCGVVLSCFTLGALPGCALICGAMIGAHRKDLRCTSLPTLNSLLRFGCAALVCAVALAVFHPVPAGITVGLIGGYALIHGLGCLWNYRDQVWRKDQCALKGPGFENFFTEDELAKQNYFRVH